MHYFNQNIFISQVRKGLSLNLQFLNATFQIEDHFNYSDCPYDWLKVGENQAFPHFVSIEIFAKISVQLVSIIDRHARCKYWLGADFHPDIFALLQFGCFYFRENSLQKRKLLNTDVSFIKHCSCEKITLKMKPTEFTSIKSAS